MATSQQPTARMFGLGHQAIEQPNTWRAHATPCYTLPAGETLETSQLTRLGSSPCDKHVWRRSRHVYVRTCAAGSFLTQKRGRKRSNARAAFACTPCFCSAFYIPSPAMQVRQLRRSQASAQWYRTSHSIDQLYSTGTDAPSCMGVP